MNHIAEMASGLQRDDRGMWVSRQQAEISHPDEWQQWYLSVEDTSYWYRHRAACIVECLRMFDPGPCLLDIGGGNGHVSLAMQAAGFQSVLVEPSMQAALNAKRRGVESIVCSTFQDAGFKPGSASAAGIFDVLEHVEDDNDFLSTLHHLLQRDGLLFLTVPALNGLWSIHDENVGHFRRYTTGSLSERLRSAGFHVQYATYLFAPLTLPIFLMRSIPTRLGLTKSSDLDRFQREHASKSGLAAAAIDRLLRIELSSLRRQRSIPLGSTCLVVARKTASPPALRQAA